MSSSPEPVINPRLQFDQPVVVCLGFVWSLAAVLMVCAVAVKVLAAERVRPEVAPWRESRDDVVKSARAAASSHMLRDSVFNVAENKVAEKSPD